MCTASRNVHKLFGKTSQRSPFIRTFGHCSSQSTLYGTRPDSEVPVEVFSEDQNVISWTSKISSLVRRDEADEAIGLFKTMLESGHRPNYVTILSIIRAAGALGSGSMIKAIHGLLLKMGFESETSLGTALLGVYSVWDVETAWKLFHQIPNRDMVLWSAMLSFCSKSGRYIKALKIFGEMQSNGAELNHVIVVSVLPVCAALGIISLGREVHGFSMRRTCYSLTNVQNSLVDMYSKCGYPETSIRVFDRIEKKDLVSWKTIIHGCIKNGYLETAMEMFSKILSSCFRPDEVIVLDVTGASGESGFFAFVSVLTSLLQMYTKVGEIGSAEIIFDQIQKKDLVAWSVMISAYAKSGCPVNALDTFKKMQSKNYMPNEITFVSVLKACSSMGVQELGESIHAHVTKAGYLSNPFLVSALIDLYCKVGRIRLGKTLFDAVLVKDVVCWSSMINGYGINGYGNEALETFSKMLSSGIKPNEVVFISLLATCSHCGLENEGWNWFYAMEKTYGITPKLAHYACMVDLLSRQGHVEEAFEFVKSMPIEPDKRIWGALLAGFRTSCRSIEMVEFVVEQLIKLDPGNTRCYAVLSNLYAGQHRWEDMEKLQELVDKKGRGRKEIFFG
ncbi:hypothetical protein NMG60_11022866 [Bertholletia excelsa]